MHGVKKAHGQQQAVQEARKKREAEEIGHYVELCSRLELQDYSSQMANIVQQILLLNPDYYTLWNWRKRYLMQLKPAEELSTAYHIENKLLIECIKKNPKSYWVWFQRQWLLHAFASLSDLSAELDLCSKMLNLDIRNFHCWNHRRWVVAAANTSLADELEYTTAKIKQNFSNYSAWHYRSTLIPRVLGDLEEKRRFIEKGHFALFPDFELIKAAYYTEPADQAAWFYHHWLIGCYSSLVDRDEFSSFLQTERNNIKELLEIEPESKCTAPIHLDALLALVNVNTHLGLSRNEQVEALLRIDDLNTNYYETLSD